MFDKEIYRIIDNMNSPEELINDNTKIVSLNFFKSQILELENTTSKPEMLAKIAAINMVLEDAYNLAMYKFQFKLFSEVLSKEINNMKEEISFGI